MEELLDSVYIKESSTLHTDTVFIVENLPKRLIYHMVPAMATVYDRDGYTDGNQRVDSTAPKVEALLPGLYLDAAGDGSVMFDTRHEEPAKALEAIDAYIAGTLPRDVVIPRRVPYAERPDDKRSNPIPMSGIPIVALPGVLRPDAPQVSPQGVSPLPVESGLIKPNQGVDIEELKKAAVEEYKAEQKEKKRAQMAKARAARTTK